MSGVANCGGAGTAMGTVQASPPGQANNLSNNSPFPEVGKTPAPNYAGTTLNKGNKGSESNPNANSQYDNACFQHQIQMP
jgi:hypothetical protein